MSWLQGSCGSIVDLRNHTGGNMWPALAGLGPLVGERAVGAFKRGAPWQVSRSGAANGGMTQPAEPEGVGWPDGLDSQPVAVLIGSNTASSGEAVALAFAGRLATRFFGARTRGLATSNQMVDLGEGLRAFVMSGLMVDRDGRDHPQGLAPDEAVVAPDDAQAAALLAGSAAGLPLNGTRMAPAVSKVSLWTAARAAC